MGPSANFLAVPNMPALHAIYRTKMPIWEIYSLVPADVEFEFREIKRLECATPELVLLSDHALDGRPEFRYSRLHPQTYRWILAHYELSAVDGGPDGTGIRAYIRADRSSASDGVSSSTPYTPNMSPVVVTVGGNCKGR